MNIPTNFARSLPSQQRGSIGLSVEVLFFLLLALIVATSLIAGLYTFITESAWAVGALVVYTVFSIFNGAVGDLAAKCESTAGSGLILEGLSVIVNQACAEPDALLPFNYSVTNSIFDLNPNE